MALNIGGLVSGLDTQSLISKLMELERRPIQLLESREKAFNVKLSAYGGIKSALSGLQSAAEDLAEADSFAATAVTSSNEDILTVSGSSDAEPGNYSIKVNSLAQAHAVRTSAFAGGDDVIGTGTISIQVGTATAVNITIDDTNKTLSGIAQAVNDADAGVSASVIDDGAGNFYLSLLADETGADNTISVTITDDDAVNTDASGLSALYNDPATQAMYETRAASNSELTVNGIDVVRSGNTIDDLITGVTLTLHKKDTTEMVAVNVSRDIDSIKEKITAFVNAYNKVVDEFASKQSYGGEEESSGVLIGDSTLRSISRRMRGLMGDSVAGITSGYNTLAGIGITADYSGKFEVDDDTLTDALDDNFDDVITLFTADSGSSQGIAFLMNDYLDDALDTTDGIIAGKEEGLQNSIDSLQKSQESMEMRIAKREEILWRQFNSLELLLSNYNQTGSFLAQQIAGFNR
jgi:flagellar hook-associated protein 2